MDLPRYLTLSTPPPRSCNHLPDHYSRLPTHKRHKKGDHPIRPKTCNSVRAKCPTHRILQDCESDKRGNDLPSLVESRHMLDPSGGLSYMSRALPGEPDPNGCTKTVIAAETKEDSGNEPVLYTLAPSKRQNPVDARIRRRPNSERIIRTGWSFGRTNTCP